MKKLLAGLTARSTASFSGCFGVGTAPAAQATFGGDADPFSQVFNRAPSVPSHGAG